MKQLREKEKNTKEDKRMNREVRLTEDGSTTLYDPRSGDTFHSIHGAVAESELIYLTYGMEAMSSIVEATNKEELHILEVGFGTGLNTLLTAKHLLAHPSLQVEIDSYELYPLSKEEWEALNFPDFATSELKRLHEAPWNEKVTLSSQLCLTKHLEDFTKAHLPLSTYDLVYYDAFAPSMEPTLWTEEVLQKVVYAMSTPSLFVTYSTKGAVLRTLKAEGLKIEKLPGPRGKREVLRASKGGMV